MKSYVRKVSTGNKYNKSLNLTGAKKCAATLLYAAFASFFNIGFSLLLNNWIYILWTFVMFPVWALNVKQEEQLMRNHFGKEYEDYCARTWRFMPKISAKRIIG